ncbi:hypothetical protein CDL12_13599 [Handroanthus impetiginosus]|uniref:F-box domain-containing protein n=1 Tax=Handroanthus impetiginosus TaxID=429701 RepID=A0A2G9H8B6_9LAMI|nr:hypothetical protein CDL12_13599 [Handroanthus impetiginosus]
MIKRTASAMVARSFKKMKLASSTNIESLPKELLIEVLARVGASSLPDLFNAKLSCKTFYEAAEDIHVYQHVSLDNFPFVEWKSLSEKQQDFLTRCVECRNPEIIFRQGVVDFFSGKGIESGLRFLQKAINLKHDGAKYVVICIILFFSRNDELKEKGIKILARMKMSKTMRQELKAHRDKFINMLRSIWVKMPLTQCHPLCCTRVDNHKKRTGWPNEEEEDVRCEACSAYAEVNVFSGIRFSQQCLLSDNFLSPVVDQVMEHFS